MLRSSTADHRGRLQRRHCQIQCTTPRHSENCFKWAANVYIGGEQLAEHNYDYLTTRADRERRQNQDKILLIEDKDFETDANRRREVLTKAFNEAIDNADRLKAECESLGINLDPYLGLGRRSLERSRKQYVARQSELDQLKEELRSDVERNRQAREEYERQCRESEQRIQELLEAQKMYEERRRGETATWDATAE